MKNNRRLYRIVRLSNRLLNCLQWTILKDKSRDSSDSMYPYQKEALIKYNNIVQLAQIELIKELKN